MSVLETANKMFDLLQMEPVKPPDPVKGYANGFSPAFLKMVEADLKMFAEQDKKRGK